MLPINKVVLWLQLISIAGVGENEVIYVYVSPLELR